MDSLLYSSCRMAFAALVHDIGKFAERAKLEISLDIKEQNEHTFCPKNKYSNFTHIHAAYTGIAIDTIEKYIPKINNAETFPFQIGKKDDSIISAAAGHHNPETYLQHIISTADRLSSAFERTKYDDYNQQTETEDYQCARLVPLFEELNRSDGKPKVKPNYQYRYPLEALSSNSIFPALKSNISKAEATQEYKELWKNFIADIQKIKNVENWNLWFDAFDTLYSVYTQHIPSASYKTVPDVSLYDHSKSTAAIATALWRYHFETKTETTEDLKQDEKNKFLLIQSDTSGIQNFIFNVGKSTRKSAYKILRGRSFFISLINECAALKILNELDLPSTSQILNAAGKFIILAPNTEETKEKLQKVKNELSNWLLQKFYGELSIGISTIEACQKDFEEKQFKQLQLKIHQSLGKAKLQQFDLCRKNVGICENFFDEYDNTKGICCFDGKMPAEENVPNSDNCSCKVCLDILSLGENLTAKKFISIAKQPIENGFSSDLFGYYIGWKPVKNMLRLWDISLPRKDESIFNGAAKRYINAYVPKFTDEDILREDFYKELDTPILGKIKTFSHLAVENCFMEDGKRQVKPAIMCLKGDIDNLGSLFQKGVENPTFATIAQLSRQINDFFTIWLPYYQSSWKNGKNIYTIFAGGDDFYLVGPWLDLVNFVPVLKEKFTEYMCGRSDITFSVGMCMTRSGDDVVNMSAVVENALENAKGRKNEKGEIIKNGLCCFGEIVSFDEYSDLQKEVEILNNYKEKYNLSTGYIYNLQKLCEQAEKTQKGSFIDAMWRSKLAYRTARFIEQYASKEIDETDKIRIINELTEHFGAVIEKYTTKYKIALYTWLYQQRGE